MWRFAPAIIRSIVRACKPSSRLCCTGPARRNELWTFHRSSRNLTVRIDTHELTTRLKDRAGELGFDLVGACPAVPAPGLARFDEWLDAGYHGEMAYLPKRREAYRHPDHVLPGARSVLMLSMNYRTEPPATGGATTGRVARYAWGVDYHDLIRERLNHLADDLRSMVPEAAVRGVVDTAPLLEREYAQLAGLGWLGKNTLLLNTSRGSYFFLAALLTDQPLAYDQPQTVDHCGTCRACIDACPTDAFVDEYVLDATRCISYLTIEQRGAIAEEFREPLGDWVFGCDVCQEVCPWNQKSPPAQEPAFEPRDQTNPLELCALFELDEAAFRRRFRGSPLWRARRRGLLHSAAIVLGNHGDARSLDALERGLDDGEPLVRAASAWALGRLAGVRVRHVLEQRLLHEQDVAVMQEIRVALARDAEEE